MDHNLIGLRAEKHDLRMSTALAAVVGSLLLFAALLFVYGLRIGQRRMLRRLREQGVPTAPFYWLVGNAADPAVAEHFKARCGLSAGVDTHENMPVVSSS